MRRRDALAAGFGFSIGIAAWFVGSQFGVVGALIGWALCPALLLSAAGGAPTLLAAALAVTGALINSFAFLGLSAVLPRPSLQGPMRVIVFGLLAMYWLVPVGGIPLLMLFNGGSSD